MAKKLIYKFKILSVHSYTYDIEYLEDGLWIKETICRKQLSIFVTNKYLNNKREKKKYKN